MKVLCIFHQRKTLSFKSPAVFATITSISPSCKHIKGRLYLFFGKKSFLFLFNTNLLLIFVAIYNSPLPTK